MYGDRVKWSVSGQIIVSPVAKDFILGSDHILGKLPEFYLIVSTRISLLRLLASYVNWFYTYKLLVLRSALTYVTSAFCRTTLLYMRYRMKNEISSLSCIHEMWQLTVLHLSCRGQSQMSYTSNIWLYPLHDWWRAINEMSNFMHSGEMGDFIFHPVSKQESLMTVS